MSGQLVFWRGAAFSALGVYLLRYAEGCPLLLLMALEWTLMLLAVLLSAWPWGEVEDGD